MQLKSLRGSELKEVFSSQAKNYQLAAISFGLDNWYENPQLVPLTDLCK